MPTNSYSVECVRLEDNPNEDSIFTYIAYFESSQKPQIKLSIAALPGQYRPGETYSLAVGS